MIQALTLEVHSEDVEFVWSGCSTIYGFLFSGLDTDIVSTSLWRDRGSGRRLGGSRASDLYSCYVSRLAMCHSTDFHRRTDIQGATL